MTTKHKKSQSTSKKGVRFVESVVNEKNCIFQEIALENDIGNDAIIELIQDEQATGCCIGVQIKSGASYFSDNGICVLKGDKDHFEYWHSHLLPIAAIIYHPIKHFSAWFDITEYLSQRPNVIDSGPYTIEISKSQEFSIKTFNEFKSHFLKYLEPYKKNFGLALEKFSDISNPRNCLDGFNYLFSFQRQNIASWYYLISCFQNFRRHRLLFQLIEEIAYLPGHGDIFWHKKNKLQRQIQETALNFLRNRFGRAEILCMLEVLTEGGGFARGTIGQPVEAIISQIKDREKILESIVFDPENSEDIRYWALLLLTVYSQSHFSGKKNCLRIIKRFKDQFPNDDSDINELVSGIGQEIETNGKFNLFC